MPEMPKTFVVNRQFKTLPEAQAAYDNLVREIDRMFRYVRADFEKVESRVKALEP